MSVAAQLVLPDYLRARGMAIFLMTVMAGGAAGAAIFGALADAFHVRASLLSLAGTIVALSLLLRHRWPIPDGD